jgi:hypothetical protein
MLHLKFDFGVFLCVGVLFGFVSILFRLAYSFFDYQIILFLGLFCFGCALMLLGICLIYCGSLIYCGMMIIKQLPEAVKKVIYFD